MIDYYCKICDYFFKIKRESFDIINPLCPKCDRGHTKRAWGGAFKIKGFSYKNGYSARGRDEK